MVLIHIALLTDRVDLLFMSVGHLAVNFYEVSFPVFLSTFLLGCLSY